MKNLVIIPTYNERANIPIVIARIRSLVPEAYILVVDDNSPDGTAGVVEEITKKDPKVSLLLRNKKEGLGKAYLHSFSVALKDPEVANIIMMDADLSHDPVYLPEMLAKVKDFDVVIGSRYVQGGGTEGWELWRRILSRCGNLYCRLVTGIPVHDATAGFVCLRRSWLKEEILSGIDLSGYAFIIEFKYKLWKSGARFYEVPIIFKNRREGESKLSNHIIAEGIVAPWRMRFSTPKS